jgi:hypothetical protein
MKGGGVFKCIPTFTSANLCSAFTRGSAPSSSLLLALLLGKEFGIVGFVPSRTVTTSTGVVISTYGARHGQTRHVGRTCETGERDDIQSKKISKLKSQGRMKNKDGGSRREKIRHASQRPFQACRVPVKKIREESGRAETTRTGSSSTRGSSSSGRGA